MKQTAVDKLLEYFIKEQKEGCSHWCIHDLIAQLYVAKEMEKSQNKYFYDHGFYTGRCTDNNKHESFEYFFNSYKSEQ
jgi:hypothetical protein